MIKSKRFLKIIRKPAKVIERFKERKLLKSISGIVHVGANVGQERQYYADHDLDVIWVEPIPEVFEKLIKNTKDYKKQRAFQALIAEADHRPYEFHITNNNGASSSIFELKDHKEIWPSVHATKTISLKSKTLLSLFNEEKIDPSKYQGLVMDTQGSELLVLKGAVSLLKHFQFIKTEVADFEAYEGCCQLSDINDFMISNGFREYSRRSFARPTKTGGQYYNMIYVRTD